nr:MAG TPA: SprT-like domain-containing protein Spartan/DNA Complex repair, protease, DNA BINDING [Caudoviricetes sp.]
MNAYEKSNKIETVKLSRLSKKEYKAVLSATESIVDRQKKAQMLCNYLSERFKVPVPVVRVVNRAQPHSTGYRGTLRRKTLGTYTPALQVITLYNITAIKKQVVSIKQMAATLLHEYLHHYDYTVLKLGASPHTAGFYKRISDLENKLK